MVQWRLALERVSVPVLVVPRLLVVGLGNHKSQIKMIHYHPRKSFLTHIYIYISNIICICSDVGLPHVFSGWSCFWCNWSNLGMATNSSLAVVLIGDRGYIWTDPRKFWHFFACHLAIYMILHDIFHSHPSVGFPRWCSHKVVPPPVMFVGL